MQYGREPSRIEAELKLEIKQADQFFDQIMRDEKAWAAGKNLRDT